MHEKSICKECGKKVKNNGEYCDECIIDMQIKKLEAQLEV